jgi:hypothetical protein
MEMEERPGSAREVTALALPQLRELTQLREQLRHVIKIFVRRMPHKPSMDWRRRPDNAGGRISGRGWTADREC